MPGSLSTASLPSLQLLKILREKNKVSFVPLREGFCFATCRNPRPYTFTHNFYVSFHVFHPLIRNFVLKFVSFLVFCASTDRAARRLTRGKVSDGVVSGRRRRRRGARRAAPAHPSRSVVVPHSHFQPKLLLALAIAAASVFGFSVCHVARAEPPTPLLIRAEALNTPHCNPLE